MAIVHLRVSGREYDIACDDGQEEQLRILADEVDERVRALSFSMGENPGEAMGLLLAALTMADELIENKCEIERLGAGVPRRDVAQEEKILEIESAMAETLEEIAIRIEKIADRIEIR